MKDLIKIIIWTILNLIGWAIVSIFLVSKVLNFLQI